MLLFPAGPPFPDLRIEPAERIEVGSWRAPPALDEASDEEGDPQGEVAEGEPGEQVTDDSPDKPKIALHAHLSQAYATAHDTETLGIPTDGTSDYRTAAVLLRYDASEKHSLVLQLSHERQGISRFGAQRDDVELDWAFYRHKFRGETYIEVGRLPIPNGIFNEVRDVGTVLPFFRPPVTFYEEEFFTSENLDGVLFTHSFAPRSPWRLDVDFFYGSWEVLQLSVTPVDVENAVGGQFWLHTPVSGLLLGAGVQRQEMEGLDFNPPGQADEWIDWHASIDGRFSHFVVRGEARKIDFEIGGFEARYIQLGFPLTPKLTLNLQFEHAEITAPVPQPGPAPQSSTDLQEDLAVGLNYAFRDNLLLKLENHWAEGFFVSGIDSGELLARLAANQPFDSGYMILSLSASF